MTTLDNHAVVKKPWAGRSMPSERDGRRKQRRRIFYAGISGSYTTAFLLLLIYAYSGSISPQIAVIYFLAGLCTVTFFLVLSETGFNDRFKDHHLTEGQVYANIFVQLFLIKAAPQIAFAFLGVIFLIISFGTMYLSLLRSMVLWASMSAAVCAIFFTSERLGMAFETPLDKLAAMLCFVITAAQCILVGVYSNKLRLLLYQSSVELRQANQRISELADIDELTGAYNRRCIMRVLEQEIADARRSNSVCSVAMIDLDWFKSINDTFGHPAGDEVLRTFAITIFANIRDTDKFGRYGGEEFILMLSPVPDDAGLATIDRLRELIAQIEWSTIASGIKVSISAGIAVSKPGENADALLARADTALYQAKASGRNRVLMA